MLGIDIDHPEGFRSADKLLAPYSQIAWREPVPVLAVVLAGTLRMGAHWLRASVAGRQPVGLDLEWLAMVGLAPWACVTFVAGRVDGGWC